MRNLWFLQRPNRECVVPLRNRPQTILLSEQAVSAGLLKLGLTHEAHETRTQVCSQMHVS